MSEGTPADGYGQIQSVVSAADIGRPKEMKRERERERGGGTEEWITRTVTMRSMVRLQSNPYTEIQHTFTVSRL